MTRSFLLVLTIPFWLAVACSAPSHRSTLVSRPPAEGASNLAQESPGARLHASADDPDREVLAELDLETALAEARAQHPGLAAARAAVDAAVARANGAGRLPNPELVAGMEVAPLNSGSTTGDAEYVLGLSQAFPLGDRLESARSFADAQRIQATHELAAREREIERGVRGAFGTALYAQRVALLRQELLETSRRRLEVAESRRAAGELLRGDLIRVRQQRALDQIELEHSADLAEQAHVALANALGNRASVGSVSGDLEAALELPALDELLARLDSSPALLAVEASNDVARARLELSTELRTPDVRLGLFYRRQDATGTDTFDFGLAIPLRVYDSGRARVLEDQARVARAAALADSSRLELEAALRDAHARARHALRSVALLADELLPEAERRADAMQRRHVAGDVALAELLEARRALVELRLTQVASMHDALTAWADLAAFLEASA